MVREGVLWLAGNKHSHGRCRDERRCDPSSSFPQSSDCELSHHASAGADQHDDSHDRHSGQPVDDCTPVEHFGRIKAAEEADSDATERMAIATTA